MEFRESGSEVGGFKIDGVYSKSCQEKIEKIQSISKHYAKENCEFNYKIMTFDSIDLKGDVAVDDYDVVLIKCEDEKDIQELHKLNLRCIFFSSDEALISFASFLYILSCDCTCQNVDPLDDTLSSFVNTKVPLKYDVNYANVLNSLENVKCLYITFFEKGDVELGYRNKRIREIVEVCRDYQNDMELCLDICIQDVITDVMAFYI